jgi:peptide/nickel transport system substrate-binding protein
MKKILAIVLATILLLGASACSSAPAATPTPAAKAPQKLTLAHRANPTSLSPLTVTNVSANGAIQYFLYDTLVLFDQATDSFKPLIATKWEQVDATHIKFTLRNDVKAHDGSPVKASDVLYTITTGVKSGKLDNYYARFNLAECKVVDDTTIILATKVPDPYLFYTLANNALGITSEEAVKKAGGLDTQTQKPTAATGPYKFVSWEQGSKIVFARNENYWGTKAFFDTVEVRIITDPSARMINLESGDVNIVIDPDLNQIKTIAGNKKFQVLNVKTKSINMAFINTTKPFFADVKVRQAMAMALDYKSIATVSMGEYGVVTDSIFPPASSAYSAPDSAYPNYYKFDLAAAKKLMSESKYPNGFTFTLKYSENAVFNSIVQLVQNQLKQIGITVVLAPTASTVFYTDAAAGNFDMYLAGASNPDPFALLMWFDGRLTWAQANGGAGWKGGDVYYAALDKAKSTMDTPARNALLKQVQGIANSEVPALVLGSQNRVVVADANLTGIMYNPFYDVNLAYASRK